ncbi:tRNA 2-selenouridine(34) synthase MnmH [Cocleimonas sp. KMM 6892]|uniref:tRNA 2-selenouridine(34) synthase MnmH n=1 Tax=unclassified Cocleimonas TaxID=2639732 RepID=UPI002DBAB1C3|nr:MULTISPECIES: tRNA 2-selenouridine(34) synthase MnmH [unclassified Cocleimonas]MEB8432070.1 tRNA 2-selenouridine(34) synthase MnmH [Cocleimonas sp. KMM 6892]MEC4714844.1 tRNA 2-selenouridine(34) synthase MnmH [Cocleimonas sp. KMM 6895]MEC4744342.1 tRNA 2-selenouridine(34) synthase MnmH [Cocleimonas sp. KMM 6896]
MSDLKIEGLPKGNLPKVNNLTDIFVNDIPLLDVRAPVEFKQGAFPSSVNIPLMNDAEREAVGIRYKEQGQDSAIVLGSKLVTPEIRAKRTQKWNRFFSNNPNGVLYCFRGGLRSQISQQWIADSLTEGQQPFPRVDGGYKAMRTFLIQSIERISQKIPVIVLGGRTGSGKTRLLKRLPNSIDLEGLANHRGSAFGPTATPQPTPINFENALAVQLLKAEAAGHKFLVVEDEARNVGSVGIPQAFFDVMQTSKLVMLEVSQEERNKVSIEEYILDTQHSFNEVYGEELGAEKLSEHLINSLGKIQKRLGGVRYKEALTQMEEAITLRNKTGSVEGFIPLVKSLLIDYYDPMYDYQSAKKKERISFKGSYDEVISYLKTLDY